MFLVPSIVVGTILFGTIAMILLLGIERRNLTLFQRIFLVTGVTLVALFNFFLFIGKDSSLPGKFYMLTVHLPLIGVFSVLYPKKLLKIVFTLFTAIFLTFPYSLSITIVTRFLGRQFPFAPYLAALIFLPIFLLPVSRFLKPGFSYMILHHADKGFWKFCLLPFLYTVFTFLVGRYNFTTPLFTTTLPVRAMFFLLTLSAYLILISLFQATREKQLLDTEGKMLHLQLDAVHRQIEELKATEEQTRFYRHDLRHHFALLSGYLEEGNLEGAKNYLSTIWQDVEEITPLQCCENATANLILSFFAARAKRLAISLSISAEIPKTLPLSETALCVVLSNALENAMTAVCALPEGSEKWIRFISKMPSNHLLILIENPFAGVREIKNGLPVAASAEHGFGTKSIMRIAEENGGLCSFEAKDGLFCARILL